MALLGRGLGWLPASVLSRLGAGVEFQPKIVLLDTGMIVELSREDKDSLMGFFKSLTKMDGRGLGQAILKMAVGETCKVGARVLLCSAGARGGEVDARRQHNAPYAIRLCVCPCSWQGEEGLVRSIDGIRGK